MFFCLQDPIFVANMLAAQPYLLILVCKWAITYKKSTYNWLNHPLTNWDEPPGKASCFWHLKPPPEAWSSASNRSVATGQGPQGPQGPQEVATVTRNGVWKWFQYTPQMDLNGKFWSGRWWKMMINHPFLRSTIFRFRQTYIHRMVGEISR